MVGSRAAARIRGRRRIGVAVVAGWLLATPAAASPAQEEPPPRDPNDLPRMDAPNGQPRLEGRRRLRSDFSGKFAKHRRVALMAEPLFASLRVPFVGRRSGLADPIRGGGAGLSLDVEIWRPVWLRLGGSYSAHPVEDQFGDEAGEDGVTRTARGGLIQASSASLGVAYAMDIGRVMPLLELGAGGLWIQTPAGVTDGQVGQECLAGGGCDTGLVCSIDNICRQGTAFQINFGLTVDYRVSDHFVIGATIRYFAFGLTPAEFPIYLHGAARLGVRW